MLQTSNVHAKIIEGHIVKQYTLFYNLSKNKATCKQQLGLNI